MTEPTPKRRGVFGKHGFKLVALLPIGILLFLLASWSADTVEAVYSDGLYRHLAQGLSRLTGWIPFSVAEALVLASLVWLGWKAVSALARIVAGKNSFKEVVGATLAKAIVIGAVVYFLFLVSWGLNYQRQPLATIVRLDASAAGTSELETVCAKLVERTNLLRQQVAEDSEGVLRLDRGQRGALSRAASGYGPAAVKYPVLRGTYGTPKAVLLSPVLSLLGISGIYFPFTAEANINVTLPDPPLPFTICHEMAHQRGFAREDEANYLAYLACRLHPDADFRYSGHLMATVHALRALPEDAVRERLQSRLSQAVGRDLAAIRRWREQYHTAIAEVAGGINDAYLRANGQEDGLQSYGRMVDLLIAEHRARSAVR